MASSRRHRLAHCRRRYLAVVIRDATRELVVGRIGSGKTTRALELTGGRPRVVAWDPLGQYPREHGFSRADSLVQVLGQLSRRWAKSFKIAYVPQGDPVAALHGLSVLLWEAQAHYEDGRDPRKLTLIAEELNLGFPSHALPKGQRGFRKLTLQGRHRGVDIVGVTQRPADIGAAFRGQVSRTYILPLEDEIEIAWALRKIGRERNAELRALKPHHYFEYSEGEVKKGKNRRRRKY